MLNSYICEVNKVDKRTDYKAEARFYLADNEFDYKRAVEAYDRDYLFELEEKVIENSKKQKGFWSRLFSKDKTN